MVPASSCSMLLPQHLELVMKVTRQIDQNIIDVTGDLRWHRIRVHGVDIDRYRHEGYMELLQHEIFLGGDSIQLAWTLQYLRSPAAMAEVIKKSEKRTAIAKLNLTSQEENDRIMRHDIWIGGRRHTADNFVDISLDTLCSTCCHSSHNSLQ